MFGATPILSRRSYILLYNHQECWRNQAEVYVGLWVVARIDRSIATSPSSLAFSIDSMKFGSSVNFRKRIEMHNK